MRWLFGAVLAAVLCSPIEVSQRWNTGRPRSGGRLVLECRAVPKALPITSPATRGRTVAKTASVEPEPGPEPGPVRVPRPRRPHPSEQGWCVDDDGVRGVRLYLFHDSGRARASRARTSVTEGPREFDDLAVAVRAWLGLAT